MNRLEKLAMVMLLVAMHSFGVRGTQAGLVAHYTFDERSGTTVNDVVGTANAVVKENLSPGWTSGCIGVGALTFNGSDWAEGPAAVNPLAGLSSFSVTWWMKTTQGSKDAGIISADGGSNRFILWRNGSSPLYVNSGKEEYFYGLGAGNYFNDGQWHHYALTKQNEVGWQLYQDGIAVSNSSAQATFVQGNNTLRFARHSNDKLECRWPGTLDDVGMWNEPISAQRIAMIHGLGKLANADAGAPGIDAVLNAFQTHSSTSVEAGRASWRYVSASELGNPVGKIGTIGGTPGVDAFIVLDSSGNGIQYNPYTVGAGVSLISTGVDTANGPRLNVDEGYSRVLDPGEYRAMEFSFAYGQEGKVIPFLARLVGDHQYEVLALGDPAGVSGYGEETVAFGGDDVFQLDAATRVYAGFLNPSGSNNPVRYKNGTTTLTDHIPGGIAIPDVGGVFSVTSFPNLPRTYAFAITLAEVPEPSGLALAALGLAGGAFWRRRKRPS